MSERKDLRRKETEAEEERSSAQGHQGSCLAEKAGLGLRLRVPSPTHSQAGSPSEPHSDQAQSPAPAVAGDKENQTGPDR